MEPLRKFKNPDNIASIIEVLEKEAIYEDNHIYLQLENIANYYAGEFTELTENISFMKVANDFFKLAFMKGKAYLTYRKSDKTFLVLEHIKDNKYQQYNTNNYFTIVPSEIVSFSFGLGNLWLQWYQLFKREKELFNIWSINALYDSKKYFRQINNNNKELLDKQTKDFFDTTKPFIDIYTILSDNENGFENTFVEAHASHSNTAISYENLIQHFKFFADRLGYSVSQESKRERLTYGENLINTHNTNNLMTLPMRNLKVLCYEIKEKWNVHLSFERVEELITDNDSSIKVKGDNENE